MRATRGASIGRLGVLEGGADLCEGLPRPLAHDSHGDLILVGDVVDGLTVEMVPQVGRAYGLPVLFPRTVRHFDIKHNLGKLDEAFYESKAAQAEAEGHVLFDRVLETPWQASGSPLEVYTSLLKAVPKGLSFLSLHCNAPGEVELIEPDQAHIRVNEYKLFRDRRFIEVVESLDIGFIGFREIRDTYRSRLES